METATRTGGSRRLTLLSTGLAVFIAFVLLMGHQFIVGRAQLLEEIRTEAAIIGANSAAALVFDDAKAAAEILGAIRLTPRIVGAALYRDSGTLLARDPGRAAAFPKVLPPGNSEQPGHAGADVLTTGLGMRGGVLRESIVHEGIVVGSLLLHLSFDSLYWRMLEYALGVLGITAVALALAYRFTAGLRQRMVKTEQRLEQLALYDQVTGLPNRRLFEQELRKAAARIGHEPKGAALLFIDVDDFKKVNDSFGHEVGDRVLAMIGDRLRETVRGADAVARLGGDEFGVILYAIDGADNAGKVARDMIAAIAEPIPTQPTPTHVGLSVGIVLLPDDGVDPVMLLRRADMAMYAAKTRGKNGFHFFSEELDGRIRRDLQLEAGLRKALAEGSEELWLAYQPQLCAKTGALRGVEALLRWQRSSGENIAPGEFIPVAESTGLINEVGEWVLRRVCQDLAAMRAAGLEISRVAVNVSPRQLLRGLRIVETFRATIIQYGEQAEHFEFELTESALMEDGGAVVLDAILAAGFSLAIDDFGTGYSSLGYLKRFRVSKLKIDQRFVRELPDNADDAAIVSAVIQMASALNIRVVAEGVETPAQSAFLVARDCDILQGYLHGRPMRPSELVSRFRAQLLT